ncbi:archaellin/type IV pilin N-terminal domain-containing protein [Methanocalculus taiwanensis]|uniref:archaellin/type IV pilin N-terminal domain-containing protein n=1 Tax=Methanocalculus taiwanensis TaxID=106207 RepID=UPI0021007A39
MDDALTGLESAIVLIAFVVVAAVFSHTLLSAGLELSEGAGTEVHKGTSRAGSGVVVSGTIFAVDLNDDPRYADLILLPVRVLPGSDPVDLRRITINLIGRDHIGQMIPNAPLFLPTPGPGCFSVSSPIRPDNDPILVPGDMVTLAIRPNRIVNLKSYDSPVIEIISPGIHPLRVPLMFPGSLTTITPVG